MSTRNDLSSDPTADTATAWLTGSGDHAESSLEQTDGAHSGEPTNSPPIERTDREFRLEQSDEFLEPMNQRSEVTEPFSSPEKLVERVNPDYGYGEPYESNCADCARCFERSWRGHGEEAAGRAYQLGDRPDPGSLGLVVEGEPSEMTEEWAGRSMEPVTDPPELRRLLEAHGPGSSALVHSHWRDQEGNSFGHAYNVVNDHGTIRTVDAQTHEVFDFDDEAIRPGISPGGQHRLLAWDPDGRSIHV